MCALLIGQSMACDPKANQKQVMYGSGDSASGSTVDDRIEAAEERCNGAEDEDAVEGVGEATGVAKKALRRSRTSSPKATSLSSRGIEVWWPPRQNLKVSLAPRTARERRWVEG